MCNVLCTSLGPTLYKRKELWKTRVNWPCSCKKRALIWICVQSQCYCFFCHPTPNSTLGMTAICNKRLIRMRELQSFVLKGLLSLKSEDDKRGFLWQDFKASRINFRLIQRPQWLRQYFTLRHYLLYTTQLYMFQMKRELQSNVWGILFFFSMPLLGLITITSRFHLDPGTVSDKTLHR